MKIFDIHTHMLYGIDDGARDSDMSLELIGMDYEQGARGIFCTNHSHGMQKRHGDYHRRFDKLNRIVGEKYPGLSLYKGCEIMCRREDMPEIISNVRADIFPSMNGTDHILMEFDPHRTRGMEEMRYCLKYALDQAYIPIIAHVERYKTIYEEALENLMQLKELGCRVQINLFSVEQDRGLVGGGSRKELANLFLKHQLVDFVGTDAHRSDYKSPEAAVGAEVLVERYGEEYASAILYRNAEKLAHCSEV